METFTNLILKRTTISKAQISKYNGSEFYVSAEGALKVGIIDSVIGDDLKSEKNGCVGKKNSRRTR